MAPPRFPHLFAAMHDAALLVQQRWQENAMRMLTTPGEREAYISGIQAGPVTETPTGFSAIVTNTWHAARRIEDGYGPYHLPDRINWSTARGVRESTKTGALYLIIPFRHYAAQRGSRAQAGTPASRRQMMPRGMYDVARRLAPGQYLTAGSSQGRAVHAPGMVPYRPRFAPNLPASLGTPIHERLLRSTRGPRAQYLTFRTMRQNSLGWWIPGKPANPIAATTNRQMAGAVRRLLGVAARADVVDHVREALHGWAGEH